MTDDIEDNLINISSDLDIYPWYMVLLTTNTGD